MEAGGVCRDSPKVTQSLDEGAGEPNHLVVPGPLLPTITNTPPQKKRRERERKRETPSNVIVSRTLHTKHLAQFPGSWYMLSKPRMQLTILVVPTAPGNSSNGSIISI